MTSNESTSSLLYRFLNKDKKKKKPTTNPNDNNSKIHTNNDGYKFNNANEKKNYSSTANINNFNQSQSQTTAPSSSFTSSSFLNTNNYEQNLNQYRSNQTNLKINNPTYSPKPNNNNNNKDSSSPFSSLIPSFLAHDSNGELSPIKEDNKYSEMFPVHNHNANIDNNSLGGGANKSPTLNNTSNNINGFNLADVTHKLHVTTYFSPTYCNYCSQFLMGLMKQGLKCEICSQNFHKKCIQEMPKICNKQLSMLINKTGDSMKETLSQQNLKFIDESLSMNSMKQIEIEHSFLEKKIYSIFRSSLICDYCHDKFYNRDKVYFSCKDCRMNVHYKCKKLAKKNCKPVQNQDDDITEDISYLDGLVMNTMLTDNDHAVKPRESNNIQMEVDDESGQNNHFNTTITIPTPTTTINNNNNLKVRTKSDGMVMDSTTNDENVEGERDDQVLEPNRTHFNKQPRKKSQIRLQRISQRVKKTTDYFWSGYMQYYTTEKPIFTTHYWKLDTASIIIYDTSRLENKLKEIPLNTIKNSSLCGLDIQNKDDILNDQKCLYILRTDNEVYYCGVGSQDQNSPMNVLARNFYNIFKMVFLPYINRNGGPRKSLKITAPRYEEKSLHEEYIINPQELLGSGQFGQVYGGLCKSTNSPVAIKVIDKTRFKDFHAETSVFQNEITILYNVQHPGIVKLFALFDEVNNLYIVTEKLATDMLDMILNKQPPRLTERVAKFIIYQILIALKKLHERNIAHCDLKPENILLTENVEFPQVKICDFGYAKIIGENSFRRSMVGTPAYSPPELKLKRVYNNSIDMWSMGVILYVSLSGTFPFEEDIDIVEQLMNFNFMFPEEPWGAVSLDAIDLIKRFLQVKIDNRMSVNKALQHRWFSDDYQLYLDLQDLETRLNQKWLITAEQDEKWNQSIHL